MDSKVTIHHQDQLEAQQIFGQQRKSQTFAQTHSFKPSDSDTVRADILRKITVGIP